MTNIIKKLSDIFIKKIVDEKSEELRKHLFWCLDQITVKILSLDVNKAKDNKQRKLLVVFFSLITV